MEDVRDSVAADMTSEMNGARKRKGAPACKDKKKKSCFCGECLDRLVYRAVAKPPDRSKRARLAGEREGDGTPEREREIRERIGDEYLTNCTGLYPGVQPSVTLERLYDDALAITPRYAGLDGRIRDLRFRRERGLPTRAAVGLHVSELMRRDPTLLRRALLGLLPNEVLARIAAEAVRVARAGVLLRVCRLFAETFGPEVRARHAALLRMYPAMIVETLRHALGGASRIELHLFRKAAWHRMAFPEHVRDDNEVCTISFHADGAFGIAFTSSRSRRRKDEPISPERITAFLGQLLETFSRSTALFRSWDVDGVRAAFAGLEPGSLEPIFAKKPMLYLYGNDWGQFRAAATGEHKQQAFAFRDLSSALRSLARHPWLATRLLDLFGSSSFL